MKKIVTLLSLCLISTTFVFAQTQINFRIKHMLGSSPLVYNQTVQNNLNQDFNIDQLFYFVSGITIIHDGGMQTPVVDKYIYVDGTQGVNESLGQFNITAVEGIKFHIGVDSPNNNTDPTTFPTGHPLSPKSPAMNWGWSAGYRFIRLEGSAGSSLSNVYQMHPLWNRNYFEQTVMTSGFAIGSDIDIILDADYIEAMRDINIAAGVIRHGADQEDLEMLENFRDHVFTPATSTSIQDFSAAVNLNIYPNPSTSNVSIAFSNEKINVDQINVLDISGKIVQQINTNNSDRVELSIETKGAYFIQLFGEQRKLTTQKLIIQ